MDQMMDMMVVYSNNLEVLVNERTQQLHEEKRRTEDLLHRMLPKYKTFYDAYFLFGFFFSVFSFVLMANL